MLNTKELSVNQKEYNTTKDMLIGKNGRRKIPLPPKYSNCHPNEKRHPGLPQNEPSLILGERKEDFMSEMCPWFHIVER
jgi:hypothetical protein